MHWLSRFASALRLRRSTGRVRALLLGSGEAIHHMAHLLKLADRSVDILGAVTLKAGEKSLAPGVRTLGPIDDINQIIAAHRPDTVYLSIPTALSQLAARITGRLESQGVAVRFLPTLRDQLEGRVGRPAGAIDVNALLQRPHQPLDEAAIEATLRGQTVLITGAGGSIGSQIARIVARFAPAQLLLMDRSENSLFEIDRRIAADFPSLSRRAILHDIADARRTADVVAQHAPHVVYHAAAHKHVPMMEDHPREAVINNLFGTKSIVDAAVAAGTRRFVMISTDKAVNPSSVMGSTKRLAELYIQHLARHTSTLCSMVRFGNVLGSACSVVPIWTAQLAEGGPLTATDPRMTRFFMTIPEAASLVIQAGALERSGGSIFILDMGDPIRIVELAERFIRMHGLEPGRDAAIVFTGARPGEKLHEELAYATEDVRPTDHPGIRLLRTAAPADESVRWMIRTFEALRHSDDRAALTAAIRHAITTLHDSAADGEAQIQIGAAAVPAAAEPLRKTA